MNIQHGEQMIDISDPVHEVEVSLERDFTGKLWVNVDGVCRLRISGISGKILKVNYRPAEWLEGTSDMRDGTTDQHGTE